MITKRNLILFGCVLALGAYSCEEGDAASDAVDERDAESIINSSFSLIAEAKAFEFSHKEDLSFQKKSGPRTSGSCRHLIKIRQPDFMSITYKSGGRGVDVCFDGDSARYKMIATNDSPVESRELPITPNRHVKEYLDKDVLGKKIVFVVEQLSLLTTCILDAAPMTAFRENFDFSSQVNIDHTLGGKKFRIRCMDKKSGIKFDLVIDADTSEIEKLEYVAATVFGSDVIEHFTDWTFHTESNGDLICD